MIPLIETVWFGMIVDLLCEFIISPSCAISKEIFIHNIDYFWF